MKLQLHTVTSRGSTLAITASGLDAEEMGSYQTGEPSRILSTNLWKCRLAMMKATQL